MTSPNLDIMTSITLCAASSEDKKDCWQLSVHMLYCSTLQILYTEFDQWKFPLINSAKLGLRYASYISWLSIYDQPMCFFTGLTPIQRVSNQEDQ